MTPPTKRTRFSVRALWGLATWLLPLAIVFFLTPVLLRSLGAAHFGVLMVVLVTPTIIGQLDLGLALSAIRNLSAQYERGKIDAGVTLFTYVACFVAIAVFLGLAIGAASPWLAKVLGFDAVLGDGPAVELVRWCVLWGTLGLALSLPPLVARATQSLALLTAIQTVSTAVLWCGALALAHAGYPLRDVVWLGIAVTVGSALIIAMSITRAIRWDGPWRFRVAVVTREAQFASGMFAAQLAGAAVYQVDRILVSSLGSPAIAGAYALCANVANKPLAAVAALSYFVFPHASGLHASGERDQLAALAHAMDRAICVLVIPLLLPGVFLAAPFLSLWLRSFATPELTTTFQLMWLAFAIPAFAVPISHVLAASGQSAPAARFAWLSALCLIAAMYLLVPRYGLTGAAVSVAISMSTSFLFSISARVKLDLPAPSRRLRFWGGIAVGLSIQLLILLPLASFARSWPSLLAIGAVAWATFYTSRAIFGLLSDEEARLLQSALKRFAVF